MRDMTDDSRPKILLPCPNCGQWLQFTVNVHGINRHEVGGHGWFLNPVISCHGKKHKCPGVP